MPSLGSIKSQDKFIYNLQVEIISRGQIFRKKH
jgi:hypothetical protein